MFAIDRQSRAWFGLINFCGVGIDTNMAIRKQAREVCGRFNRNSGRGAIMDGGEEIYNVLLLAARGYKVVDPP